MNAPVRLLVVDDDPDMHVQVRLMLRKTGHPYDISALTSPDEISARLDAASYDIMLIDHHMPAVDGPEVLRRVHGRRDAPPVIVLTMSRDPELPDTYLELGAVDFLAKDEITPGLLDRSIRYALAQWRSRRTIEEGQSALLKSERLATIGRLAAGVAHEYNNLNAVVLAGAEMVSLRVRDDPIATHHISLVISSVERSRRISSSLLQLARTQPAEPPVIDLRTQIEETAALMAPEAKRWNAKLLTRLTSQTCPVRIDRGDIHQVIANMVINGLHAAHRTIDAQVEISLAVNEGMVNLAVADNGVGIDPQDIERIFDPFFSRKSGHDRDGRFPAEVEGSGMGLAVSQQLIDQAGGSIAVASVPGRGTTLTIVLPLAISAQPPAALTPPIRARQDWRIAVLDDNTALLESVDCLLSECGYTVHAYADPLAFLRDLATLDIEVLLLDWHMPELDGIEVLARLADPGRSPPLLVVLTSGEEMPRLSPPPGTRLLGIIPKPFRIGSLIDMLAKA